MLRTVNRTVFNFGVSIRGTYRFVAAHAPVVVVDAPRRTNKVIFSRAPASLGFGRPAQSSAGQP